MRFYKFLILPIALHTINGAAHDQLRCTRSVELHTLLIVQHTLIKIMWISYFVFGIIAGGVTKNLYLNNFVPLLT